MAEKKVIELDVQSNIGSLKAQLQAAQREVYQMSEAFGATSEQAAKAATKAAALKDAISDAKALTDAFNPDAKFNALSNSIGGALNGFQAFEGAMGLVGSESEALQKTLVKVQSAMALSQGIQGAMEAKDSFVQLGAVVKNAFTGMTTAAKVFTATGIGLLITAVALLVTNMDDIKKSFNSGLASAKKYAETTEKQAEAARKAVDNFDEYARTLKRVGYSEDQINAKREKAYKDAIKKTDAQLKAQKKLLNESEKGLETAKEFDSWGFNATGRWLYGDEEDVKANKKKATEIREQLTKLKNDQYQFQQEQKKAKEDAKKEAEQAAIDRAKENSQRRLDELATLAGYIRDANDLFKSEYEIEKRNIEEKYAAELALAKKYNKGVVALEEAKKKELQDLEDKQAKDLFDGTEKLTALKATAVAHTLAFQEQEKKGLVGVAEVRKRISDYETQLDEKKKKNQQDALTATANTLGSISNLFGQQTKVGKAAAIAEATISTYLSAQKAYDSTIGVPVVGPVLAPIAAGVAIASGIKNIKAIQSVKTPNGGGSEGGALPSAQSGATAQAPSFNVVGNSGMNQLAQLQQQPTKAYVVSGDVTTAQSLDRNRIENATLVK